MSHNFPTGAYTNSMSSPVPSKLDQPWSHRQIPAIRFLITILAGIFSAMIGTLVHRMGAVYNIPYGLLLGFILVGLSAWCARSRDGIIGLALHMIASTTTVWLMAMVGPGGDAMIPVGFHADNLPFFCQNAGTIWLYGVMVVQIILVLCPRRMFTIPMKHDVKQTASLATSEENTDHE